MSAQESKRTRPSSGETNSSATGLSSMEEIADAADLLEKEAIDVDFKEAVEYVMNTLEAARKLSEPLQRQLYGLFQVGMYGPAFKKFPGVGNKSPSQACYSAREQYDSHKEAGKLSKKEAKEKYCEVLIEAIPSYVYKDDATKDDSKPATELPDQMKRAVESKLGLETGHLDSKPDGKVSLFEAIENGLFDYTKTLAAGADLATIVDASGLTPLMVACDRDHPEIVKWLLQTDMCDIDAVDPDGQTALHYCVIIESEALVNMLVAAGVKTDIKDNDGYTPLAAANESRNSNIITLLQRSS